MKLYGLAILAAPALSLAPTPRSVVAPRVKFSTHAPSQCSNGSVSNTLRKSFSR